MIHADVLGERARLTPAATALVVVSSGERLTYAQLDERAAACARLLRDELGLAKGERFALLAHNRREVLEAFYAAAKSGLVLVPLGTRLTPVELEHVLVHSGARVVLYDAELGLAAQALRARLPDLRWVALDAPDAGDVDYREATARLGGGGFVRTPCSGEDLHLLLYTSGTTGKPKGVRIPHRQVAWNGYNTVAGWQLQAGDVTPIFTPMYHAGGLLAFLGPIFTIGGTVVLHRGFDAAEVWNTIERERCTVVLGVPTIWKLLLAAPEMAAVDLSHVRWFISGGAPLPGYLSAAYQARGIAFLQGFGMTEAGVNCFAMTVADAARKPGSIGTPMMFTEVRLVDDLGGEVAVGEVGELTLRGPHVCQGYWNDPAATAAAIDAEGWFHTGDLARRDGDGYFYIAGRAKDMIISGGVNVYPAEIEAALLLHPAVEDAAVVAVPDDTWGEAGVAFVVARDGGADPAELTAHLLARLARYKLPKSYRFVPALPRTAYGKVVKGDLRAQFLAEPTPEVRR